MTDRQEGEGSHDLTFRLSKGLSLAEVQSSGVVSSSLNSEQSDDGVQQVNPETSAAAGWGGAVTTPRKEPVCSAGVWMWMSELISG